MERITITRTNGNITTYDYDISIHSCERTAEQVINELKKYAEKQNVKCVQVLQYGTTWLYMGIVQVGVINQLFIIRYERGYKNENN